MTLWAIRAATGLLLAVALVTDVRERRAPLWLTVSGIAGGLLANALLRQPLAASAIGAAAGGALLLPAVALGWVGAGDALLLAAVGAWDGWRFALWTVWWGSIAGGLLGLIAWRLRKRTLPYVPALAIGALVSALAL
ncbi:MAG TPA: A24 family peptidase [Chloroflexota bacterium]|nr:A24 family peptidase [Chloroflexota bacterium]